MLLLSISENSPASRSPGKGRPFEEQVAGKIVAATPAIPMDCSFSPT